MIRLEKFQSWIGDGKLWIKLVASYMYIHIRGPGVGCRSMYIACRARGLAMQR